MQLSSLRLAILRCRFCQFSAVSWSNKQRCPHRHSAERTQGVAQQAGELGVAVRHVALALHQRGNDTALRHGGRGWAANLQGVELERTVKRMAGMRSQSKSQQMGRCDTSDWAAPAATQAHHCVEPSQKPQPREQPPTSVSRDLLMLPASLARCSTAPDLRRSEQIGA